MATPEGTGFKRAGSECEPTLAEVGTERGVSDGLIKCLSCAITKKESLKNDSERLFSLNC